MSEQVSPIINTEDLIALQKSDIVIVDARTGINAKENYKASHLQNARYVDLNLDLATVPTDAANGGRHPLPSLSKFSEVLSKLGISPSSHIIIYDDKNSSNAAARFWWMLRAIGHKKVQVINGGLQAAVKAGFPVSSGIETFAEAALYPISNWELSQADITEIDKASKNQDTIIIDVRDKDRFDGLTEPIDLIAGHIPGATNVPFTSNLNEDGTYLSPEVLKAKYQDIIGNTKPENVIVHCGSGVTACHTLLAIDYAGLPIPKLYVGSWSEWSRNNRPMITAETK
ncbi:MULTISPECIES: sulfurtransferase [unclassified Flavobacterium]|uniref:sulfurtransferase n=1 Tax=unclassified Flavobacterium TaxID=196869 RepID=UPI00057D2F21|nr:MULTISPECIES: sulfurtransferase [unclassified Flavobacterium]KIA98360.1 sulfurtransferase [Flavobacterium sp. KMS]KIC02065.1 sulfurtransferase [Flavobacterium sp. JRM]MEA9412424.1 sulfurtransferase [Flavobacterium sp. PL02]